MISITKDEIYNTKWISENIKSHSVADNFSHFQQLEGKTIFYFKREIETSELDSFLENHDPNPVGLREVRAYDLKIAPLLQYELSEAPYNVVDFKRHLKPLVTLDKRVEMNVDGRPVRAIYSYRGDKIAEINFVFRGAPLMTRRTEVLYYYEKDGTNASPIVIKDKIFDMMNSKERSHVMQEREKSRSEILNDVNGSILGIIQNVLGLNETEISALVVPYFNEFQKLESEFIKLGSDSYAESLRQTDLTLTPHQWLTIQIQAGVTVRDYIVSRLVYTTQETYLDFDYSLID